PDLGPLGCNALGAADVLLLPLSATAFAERALEETIASAFALRPEVEVYGVKSMTRERSSADESDEADPLRGPLGIELLDCHVVYDPETVLRATEAGLPVFEYDPASVVAHCFVELAREVIHKVLSPAARLSSSGRFLRPSSEGPAQ
ncbi:MAG: ParA family protein, partial [Planctomycetota bacterium]